MGTVIEPSGPDGLVGQPDSGITDPGAPEGARVPPPRLGGAPRGPRPGCRW